MLHTMNRPYDICVKTLILVYNTFNLQVTYVSYVHTSCIIHENYALCFSSSLYVHMYMCVRTYIHTYIRTYIRR